MGDSKRIVFFGSPASALPALERMIEAGHQIMLILTQPDRPSGRGKAPTPSPVKRFALEKRIPVYQPEKIKRDPSALERIRQASPDLNVVVAYGQIIPGPIIYFPRHHSLNLHFSLLPKYRGGAPVAWAILNGETSTGVTIFELNERMDEGDILSREEVEILPQEGAAELETRLAQVGADLLIRTIDQIERIKPVKQGHSLASSAPLLKKEDGRVNWSKNAVQIERQVRAFNPWPSAYTFFKGRRIKILKGRSQTLGQRSALPGEITFLGKEGIGVNCGSQGVYIIETLQPENKRPMTAHAFSLGAELKAGDKFV